MKGLIILEGPDACGKTTLQNYLAKEFNAIKIHLTYPAPAPYKDMYEYQMQSLLEAIKLAETQVVIVDRHWISEAIYAYVFRNGSPWPNMGREFDEMIVEERGLYIICLPWDRTAALKRHKDELDPSHPYNDNEFLQLLTAYEEVWAGNDKFVYNNYITEIIQDGGFSLRGDAIPYSIECEGKHMDHFAQKVRDFFQWK